MDCLHHPPPPSPFCKSLTLTTFILSLNRGSCLREGSRDGAGGGDGAITWEQTLIMAADALLHFHSCGVAHLWAAITDQMIQTGPCDEVAGLTEWLAALFFFACVHSIVLYACPICLSYNRAGLLCTCMHCVCVCAHFAWTRNSLIGSWGSSDREPKSTLHVLACLIDFFFHNNFT